MQHGGEYRVTVAKDYLVFASAHFITFAGHRCETLHGHNYRVAVTIGGVACGLRLASCLLVAGSDLSSALIPGGACEIAGAVVNAKAPAMPPARSTVRDNRCIPASLRKCRPWIAALSPVSDNSHPAGNQDGAGSRR